MVLIPCTNHTCLSVDNSIVYWIPYFTHHICHVTILIVVSQSVRAFVWAFTVPFTVKTDMISLFSRLRSNQFTTVQSYPLISIHFNIRIIGLILAARKDSKIAITRSCHLVSVWSANVYVYATYTYPNQSYGSLSTWYVQLRTLKLHTQLLVPNLHWYGFFHVSFPFYPTSTLPFHIQSSQI